MSRSHTPGCRCCGPSAGEYRPSLVLALRIAAVFGLPVEAVFSLSPFRPLSEQVYGKSREEVT